MKFAIVDGARAEAFKSGRGSCPACGSEMIARICKDKVDHWAHKRKQECDHWWENETDWHRGWKNCFDTEWQEVVHRDIASGEVHIADVSTPYGWTIEFQHSRLDDEERLSRNNFYKKIAWVVDGTRRKRDVEQLNNLLSNSVQMKTHFPTYAVDSKAKNKLLEEWRCNESLVFFDFKQMDKSGQRIIWFVVPDRKRPGVDRSSLDKDLFIQMFPASCFIETHRNGAFEEFFSEEIYSFVDRYAAELDKIRSRYARQRYQDARVKWLIGS